MRALLLMLTLLFTGCITTGALFDHYGVRHQYKNGAMPTLVQLERSWLMDEYVINSATGYRGATRQQIEQCLWDTSVEIVAGDAMPCKIEGKDAKCYGLAGQLVGRYDVQLTDRECWYDSAYVHEMAHVLQECLHTEIEQDFHHEEAFFFGPRGFVRVWADTTRTGWLCDIMNAGGK